MNVPKDLRYSKERMGTSRGRQVRVGITDFAQSNSGHRFVNPEVGTEVTAGEPFGSVSP